MRKITFVLSVATLAALSTGARKIAFVLSLAALAAACTGAPLAPSQQPNVNLRVDLYDNNRDPVAGAIVTAIAPMYVYRTTTDAAGLSTLPVPAGQSMTLHIEHSDYRILEQVASAPDHDWTWSVNLGAKVR